MDVLLASTTSSVDSTPTAPPQKLATMGSTCASCWGRCTLRMNCSYEVPAQLQQLTLRAWIGEQAGT